MWAFNSTKAVNPNLNSVRVIMTNGNKWKIIQIGNDASFEKTGYYFSEVDRFEKIYNDKDMQSLALGIIKYALN